MPTWIARLLPFITRLPWARVVAMAAWVYTAGKKRLEENLTQRERDDLTRLLTRSKGLPGNLTERERERVRRLVHKALVGRFPA